MRQSCNRAAGLMRQSMQQQQSCNGTCTIVRCTNANVSCERIYFLNACSKTRMDAYTDSIREHTRACASIRKHTQAYASIREREVEHTRAYVS